MIMCPGGPFLNVTGLLPPQAIPCFLDLNPNESVSRDTMTPLHLLTSTNMKIGEDLASLDGWTQSCNEQLKAKSRVCAICGAALVLAGSVVPLSVSRSIHRPLPFDRSCHTPSPTMTRYQPTGSHKGAEGASQDKTQSDAQPLEPAQNSKMGVLETTLGEYREKTTEYPKQFSSSSVSQNTSKKSFGLSKQCHLWLVRRRACR